MRYLCLLLILISVKAEAQKYLTKEGQVVFISNAPLSSFEGKSKYLQGLIDLEKNMLDFYLDLNTLKTGIGLRDRHMRENYLETEDFPFAEFTGKLSALPRLTLNEKVPVTATGLFRIHGKEKEIQVEGTLMKISDSQIILDAEFKVLLSDFDIPLPSLVFYELAEEQQVVLSATLSEDE